jgi:ATP-dependent RNA circularization protein (DNA/RNA ligase family)
MDITIPADPADDNPYTAIYRSLNMREKLEQFNLNIVIQGELCGPHIQKNRLGLQEYHWYVFDIFDLDTHSYLHYEKVKELCADIGIERVPLIEEGEAYPAEYTLERLLEKADCKYSSGQSAEGIVVRLSSNEYLDQTKTTRASFKVLNNKFLLKSE